MNYPDERMSLFIDRSVSECIEATFDFMRINRRIWLRSAITLMAGGCVLYSLMVGNNQTNVSLGTWGNVIYSDEMSDEVLILFSFLGLWLAYIHCYSLLIAYMEQGSDLNTISQRQMLPYYLSVARRTWWFVILLAALLALGSLLGGLIFVLVLLFVMVPMAQLPSVYLFEQSGVIDSVKKSFRLGYSSWPQMTITLIVTAIVGMILTGVVQVPALLFNMLFSTMAFSVDQVPFASVVVPVLTVAPVCFSLLVAVSMLFMGAAFQYGTVTERVDEASLDADIEYFENL